MQSDRNRVAIIGAGLSGLLACKHLVERGLDPVVFESYGQIGGIWKRGVVDSTKLQTPKNFYQFSDFPWPENVVDTFPDHRQVAEYLDSYAEEFGLLPKIRFNRKVTEMDFVGKEHEAATWSEWGGSGEAFASDGKWNLTVEDSLDPSAPLEVYQVDFVIVCVGMFSGLPNIPDFPINEGPEVFRGKVIHSMDYAMMGPENAAEFVKGKRVTVVGFHKSAIDIAVEVAKCNGNKHPCTLLYRKAPWMLPEYVVKFAFGNLTRFKECLIHKPDESLLLWLLATILSPLMWLFAMLIEIYVRWKYPIKKYGALPEHSLGKQFRSCITPTMPANFYNAVQEGSLILKKSSSFSFCRNGLIMDGEMARVYPTDVVIFATGFKGDEKLRNIFTSTFFQKCIVGSSAPLYRELIHPRIPQVAILGYLESFSVLHTTEMRSKWLVHFLTGGFKLPSIREMEGNMAEWERCARRNSKESCKQYRLSAQLQIYCNDLLCRDMKCNPRRKSWFLPELFSTYGPADYGDLKLACSRKDSLDLQ
ncbi:hypothetical protein SAY87_021494 [Trapa incisa]|uniref:Flavin-containing monooxygenase n=1 Tax=Trapa incisa TaxID=236973 RepID=A0AAN7JS50_9MYRT|nr:hypothetical protein SAY87_021494 [Trapa incisa]